MKPKATDSQMLCKFKLCCGKNNSAVQMQMHTGMKIQISFTIFFFFCLMLLVKTKIFRSHRASFDDLSKDWVGTLGLFFIWEHFQPHFHWPFISWDCHAKLGVEELRSGPCIIKVLKPLHHNLTEDNEWTHKNKRRYRSQSGNGFLFEFIC